MEKIKIVFVLGTLDIGGTETQFLNVIRRLNRQQFEPCVLAFSSTGKLRAELEACQVPFETLNFTGLSGKFQPASYWQLSRLLYRMVRFFRRERPCIVQSYLLWANIYGTLAAKLAGVPCIMTGRRELGAAHARKFHYRWLQNISNLLATIVVANSEAVRFQVLQQECFLSPERLRVVYNGIDVQHYSPRPPYLLLKDMLNIPPDSLVVGVVANLHAGKGHEYVIQAATTVIQRLPGTIFLIVGRDEGQQHHLEMLVEKRRLAQTVFFLGERSDIPEILSICDVQVSASLSEGLPNVLLEGMALERAIVATDVGGTSEVIVDGDTGFLVPPADPEALASAIITLLCNAECRARMGTAGGRRVRSCFSIDRTVTALERLYREFSAACDG